MMTCMGVVPLHDLPCVEHVWQGDAEDHPRNVHHLAHHIIVRGLALQAARGCRHALECGSGHPALASADGPPPSARHPSSQCAGSHPAGAQAAWEQADLQCCVVQAKQQSRVALKQSGLQSSSGSQGRRCILRTHASRPPSQWHRSTSIVQMYSRRRMGRPFMPVLAYTGAGLAPASAFSAGCSPAASASLRAAEAPPAAVSSSLPSEAGWCCPPGSEVLAALPPAPAIPVALEAGGSLASLAPSAAAGGALRLRARCLTAGASAKPGAALGAAGCWLVQAASGGRGAPWAPVLRP